MVRLPDLHICPDHILSLSQHLLDASELFRKTGNVHSVMLCRDYAVLYMTEDLDRSRAFEKTVGRALKDRVDFAGTSVYTTGRIPRPIAEKAIWQAYLSLYPAPHPQTLPWSWLLNTT